MAPPQASFPKPFVIAVKKGDRKVWDTIDRMADRVVSKALELGGTATGEHGVGIGKRKYMATEHGTSLKWMQQLKSLFDPNGILNPGKIFPQGFIAPSGLNESMCWLLGVQAHRYRSGQSLYPRTADPLASKPPERRVREFIRYDPPVPNLLPFQH
jgi:hypothetical protein